MALGLKTFIAGTALILSACGPLGDGVTSRTLTGLVSPLVSPAEAPVQAPAAATAGLTRAAIEASPAELLLVSLVSRGSVDLLTQVAQTRDTTTWISSDGVSVSLRNDMVVASRGSGFDLMGADAAAARHSLNGGGQHRRVYETLDGLDQIVSSTYECETTFDKSEIITIVERDHATTKWREECVGSGVAFANLYWVGRDDEIVQSRQFVSFDLGYLVFQKL